MPFLLRLHLPDCVLLNRPATTAVGLFTTDLARRRRQPPHGGGGENPSRSWSPSRLRCLCCSSRVPSSSQHDASASPAPLVAASSSTPASLIDWAEGDDA